MGQIGHELIQLVYRIDVDYVEALLLIGHRGQGSLLDLFERYGAELPLETYLEQARI